MHPSQNSPRTGRFRRLLGGVAIVGALAVAGSIATGHYFVPRRRPQRPPRPSRPSPSRSR